MSSSPSVDLQDVHDFLIDVAYRAGGMITSAKPVAAGSGMKKNSADLVTETDQAVEKMVSSSLKEKYPEFEFMGEETYKEGDKLSDAPTFIVDPIDGTTNFFHGHPYLCVSLGLAINQKPVLGVIYNPFTKTLYTGIKGQGAYLTDPCHNRARLPLRDPDGNDFKVKTDTFAKLCASKEAGGAMVHGIRSLGSAELNMCGVAAGHLDLYWESGCWAWDVCAAWVIVEEAGGKVVGCHQGDWDPKIDQRRYMSVRAGQDQEKIVEEFWGCVQGKLEVGYDTVS
ncbi:inositol monophosphatase [Hortaea werneckii]|nr:inositol monophosphatase [Hortaea werneckii]KAI7275504.1 inositol monophosphatase [Hortaea werneckii]KAI7395992.1 inositol monophosphatase [Hortaea werneckii]KAI7447094.1 inositol monophosphatase [Hortaea werneckii]